MADKPRFQIVMHPRWRDGQSVMPDIKEVTLDGRPMVLIDPEDREQLQKFRDLYDANEKAYGHSGVSRDLDPLADTIRELANPKPEPRWSNGDVIQSVHTNLVWSRHNGTWYPSSDQSGRVTATDEEFNVWLEGGRELRVLREQKAGINA